MTSMLKSRERVLKEVPYGTSYARAVADVLMVPNVRLDDVVPLAAILHYRRLWTANDYPAARVVKGAKRATIESWRADLAEGNEPKWGTPTMEKCYGPAADVRDAAEMLKLAERNYRVACYRLRASTC